MLATLERFACMLTGGFVIQCFCNIVEFILSLPGSSAPVDRIFSVMNNMWSKEKSRLSVETMRATLVVRQNCVMECEKFYDKGVERPKFAA
jgi:hypothetical protein